MWQVTREGLSLDNLLNTGALCTNIPYDTWGPLPGTPPASLEVLYTTE